MRKKRHLGIVDWARDLRDSGIWFVFVLFALLGAMVGSLDFLHWDNSFGQSLLAECNSVLLDLLLLGIVIAIYDYRRRRNDATRDANKELHRLMASRTPEAVLRKIELIEDLAQAGRKPDTLANQYLTGGRLNGLDLSNVYMRFSSFTKCWLIRTRFVQADLLSADFSDSTLVQADFTGASLVEANFSGALLAGAILAGANVENADFRGARELTREQLTSANNWPNARRDPELVCGEAMPPEEKSLGEKFRAQLRQSSNPAYPYQLGTRVHSDGREETVIIDR